MSPAAVGRLLEHSGSWDLISGVGQVGVFEAEQVVQAADVAADGVDLVEDAVLAQGSWGEPGGTQGNCEPTIVRRGALRRVTNRCGLIEFGQVRSRSSSQVACGERSSCWAVSRACSRSGTHSEHTGTRAGLVRG